MERIKKALEMAREQREAQVQPQPAAEPAATAASPDAGITYSRTRTLPASREVLRRNHVINPSERDAATNAYRMLRTQVMQRMKENGWNALAVVGAAPNEGKTLTAVNLAMTMAGEVAHTVLLVDLDLRQPSIHTCFGVRPELGLSDYLQGRAELSDVLFNPGIERLVVLPGGEPLANSSEMLSSPRMASLVTELKTRYPDRFVIFDLPPLLYTDDALAFAPYVDAALLVVEEGRTRKSDILRTMDLLGATNVLGTVLNKAEVQEQAAY